MRQFLLVFFKNVSSKKISGVIKTVNFVLKISTWLKTKWGPTWLKPILHSCFQGNIF